VFREVLFTLEFMQVPRKIINQEGEAMATNLAEIKTTAVQRVDNPFGAIQQAGGNAVALSESNRAIAEVQAAMIAARYAPRNQIDAMDRVLNACTRKTLALKATYSYKRGKEEVTGPTIRLAETIAVQWGNIQFGFNELSRGIDADGVGYSEVGAYAWDLETNTRRPLQFRVRHWRDTKDGGYALKAERDIYEVIANQAQRRVRSCILAVIPGDILEAALEQCDKTLKASADTSPKAMEAMLEKFSELGVEKEQIEQFIGRRISSIQPAQVERLRKIYNSIHTGETDVSEWFEPVATYINDLKEIDKSAVPEPKEEPKQQAKKKEPAPEPTQQFTDEELREHAPSESGGTYQAEQSVEQDPRASIPAAKPRLNLS
jgi:hypothetical protein